MSVFRVAVKPRNVAEQRQTRQEQHVKKPPSTAQTHKLMSVLSSNVNWDELDSATAQRIIENPQQAGAQFATFLQRGARVNVDQPKILINLARPFDPSKFEGLGKGWTIWRGPLNGDGLTGDELQDTRSLALTEIDLTKVILKNVLKEDESSDGKEWFRRLCKQDGIRLDASAFLKFWEKEHSIPESWRPFAVIFPGTVLRATDGSACVLCLPAGAERWEDWHCDHLSSRHFSFSVGASLAS